MISNALAGYRLAADHLRQLLAVLLPVLAAALLSLALLDVAFGRGRTVIINRLPVVEGVHALALARFAVVAVFWLLGLAAAAFTAAGGLRGHAVRPTRALLAAARSFPLLAAGAAAAVGLTVVALRIVTGHRPGLARIVTTVAAGDGPRGVLDALGPAGRLPLAATLIAGGLLASRLAVGVFAHELGASGRRLTRGRLPGTVGAFLLGGIAVPLLLVLLSRFTLPLALLLQAGVLAHVVVSQLPADDVETVEARLAGLAGRPARLRWLAGVGAAAVVALLAPAGVAAANPLHAPVVEAHGDAQGSPIAAAWPTGRHPVIATVVGARFCDNDVCDRYVAVDGGPAVMDTHGAAGISADGTSVVKATLTGGLDTGGPFLNYARCTRDGCRQAWLPVRASARERFAWPEMGAAVAPDGALWFALATPSDDDKSFRVSFLRCVSVGCPRPERHDAGTVQHIADPAASKSQRVHLSVGADGRPTATIRTGAEAVQVTCCDPAKPAALTAGEPGTVWTAEPGRVIAFQAGRLRAGDQLLPLPGGRTAEWSGAVATTGGEVYVTAAEAPEDLGYPARWQQVVWRCGTAVCRRQVLDTFPTTFTRETMAVAADGRVFIARSDRILLLSAGWPAGR